MLDNMFNEIITYISMYLPLQKSTWRDATDTQEPD